MRILHLPRLNQIFIATCIMDLQFNLLFLDSLGSFVDVEHGWFVLLAEIVKQIVANQTGLSHGSVAN